MLSGDTEGYGFIAVCHTLKSMVGAQLKQNNALLQMVYRA